MLNKYCFTIYITRSTEDFKHYDEELIKSGIFTACEIFYPYQLSAENQKIYEQNVRELFCHTNIEKVIHLPYGKDNNLASKQNIDEVMKRLKDAIDFARYLGIKKLTIHPGQIDENSTFEEARDLSVKNMQILADYCVSDQMNLNVENMPGRPELCVTPEEMMEYLQLVNRPNVKVTLDTGHAHVAKQDLKHFVHYLKDYLHHTHLSDNDQSRDAHELLGKGTIDFKAFLEALKEINYQEMLCLEVLHRQGKELIPMALVLEELTK